MTRATRVLALCSLLIASAPAAATAEWQLAPFAGFTVAGDTNFNLVQIEKQHWNIGGTVRLLGAGPLGLEAIFLFVPGHLEPIETPEGTNITSTRSMALMGNVVLTTPRAWNQYGLRPYISGGAGWLHAFHNDPVFPLRANVPGYNVGGGAVGLLSDRVGLRFDLRFVRTLPPGKEPTPEMLTTGDRARFRYWAGTIGVVFKY